MKTVFALSITALLATTASAAQPSPVAAPQSSNVISEQPAAAKPLAIMKETGGFCGGPCPATVLTLQDNGHIVAETTVFFPTPSATRAVVAQYNKKLINVIKYEISRLTEAPIMDFNPEGPICADKAEKSFFVVKDGKEVIIGAERDCHEFYMENFQGMGLVDVLKSLSVVYSFSVIPVPSRSDK